MFDKSHDIFSTEVRFIILLLFSKFYFSLLLVYTKNKKCDKKQSVKCVHIISSMYETDTKYRAKWDWINYCLI